MSKPKQEFPSPEPWSLQQNNHRCRHHTYSVWTVTDANHMTIAEFVHEVDARWFMENSPDAPIPTSPRDLP